MIAVAAVFFVIFIGLGIITYIGKADTFILGNANNGRTKDDISGARKFAWKSMLGLGVSSLLCLIGQLVSLSWLYELGLYLFCGIVIIIAVKRGKPNKSKKK